MIIDFLKKLKKAASDPKPESNLKRFVINVENQEKRIAFLVGERLEDFYIDRQSDEPVTGNIYKGIVRNIVPSIQAAFIDIGCKRNGFIHVGDVKENVTFEELLGTEELPPDQPAPAKSRAKLSISDALKEGQEILVQVKKEAIGQKGVRLTTNISIPGRNLVFIPDAKQRGISRKITDRKERARLREMLRTLKLPKDHGIIVRTAGQTVTQKHFESDIAYLMKTWQTIRKNIKEMPPASCVHVEMDIALKTLREMYTPEIDEIIVDSKDDFVNIRRFFRHFFPGDKVRIGYYKRKKPIFDVYQVEKELDKIFQRKVWLKCGGYLIIDETEALVAIDVNTGRNLDSDTLEKTIMKTNLDAAEEIARQLRLRNIGGIIVIDFIDMAKKNNRKAVLKKLEQSLERDKAKNNILPISELGLIEMTRQRVKESINQELYEKCPCCEGRGMIKSMLSISIETSRKIKRVLLGTKEKKVKFGVHPTVLDLLRENNSSFPKNLERAFRKKLYFEMEADIAREKLKVHYLSSGKIEFI
ncbi:MAG: Rne/Rng family ribonuclease [Candidatus Auribacterota bacterium]